MNVRFISLLCLVFGLSVTPVFAASFWSATSEFSRTQGQGTAPNVSGYMLADLSGKIGGFGFIQVSEVWSQAYAGPVYSITKFWSIGAGGGVEQADGAFQPRFAATTAVIGHSRYYLLGVYEQGQAEWYRVMARYKFPGPGFQAGLAIETGLGSGLSVAFVAKQPRWYVPDLTFNYHPDRKNNYEHTVFAVSYAFPR